MAGVVRTAAAIHHAVRTITDGLADAHQPRRALAS